MPIGEDGAESKRDIHDLWNYPPSLTATLFHEVAPLSSLAALHAVREVAGEFAPSATL